MTWNGFDYVSSCINSHMVDLETINAHSHVSYVVAKIVYDKEQITVP